MHPLSPRNVCPNGFGARRGVQIIFTASGRPNDFNLDMTVGSWKFAGRGLVRLFLRIVDPVNGDATFTARFESFRNQSFAIFVRGINNKLEPSGESVPRTFQDRIDNRQAGLSVTRSTLTYGGYLAILKQFIHCVIDYVQGTERNHKLRRRSVTLDS